VNSLEDHLEAVVAAGVPGAVAVVGRPGGRLEAAAGVADMETEEPMTPDHWFRIGSVTNMVVAALVLQLVDEGSLALDDDAGAVCEGVTIRQLLSHTSGLPTFADDLAAMFELYQQDRDDRPRLAPRDLLALAMEKPRLFAPGAGWAYSPTNYIVLRLIVEETTGSMLRDELTSRILEPLRLVATDLVEPPLRDGAALARGYLPADNPLLPASMPVDVTDLELPFYAAVGGIVSTAGEVARFLQALLGGDLLPSHLLDEMLRTVESEWEETDRYGLGIGEITTLGTASSSCGSAWGHLGFLAGYTTIALSSENGDRQVVVATNGLVMADEAWDLLGRLVWDSYCV
jgi:D-alanyl-D-alanine carboxypeptidase